MRALLALIIIIFSFNAFANLPLKVGDILLQPLNCWSCNLIEAEEATIYSHIGMVISTSPVMVAEALGSVRQLPLETFTARTEKNQKISVIRSLDPKIQSDLSKNADKLKVLFKTQFEGKKYDKEFLWDNTDDSGNEKFYCSEFISKILFKLLALETPLKRMHFNQNRALWDQYFHGNIPDDQWGNSPGDFERSDRFFQVGEL